MGRKIIVISLLLLSVVVSAATATALVQKDTKEDSNLDSGPYVFSSADVETHWPLVIDTQAKRVGIFDSSGSYSDCSTKEYYCVSGAIEFSAPKSGFSPKNGDRSWSIGKTEFSSSFQLYSGYNPCDLSEDDLYRIDAKAEGTELLWSYLYSNRNGLVVINLKDLSDPSQSATETYFMCRSKLLAESF